MIRTQVSLTEQQMERLRRIARDRGVSIAAVVRDAIDALPDGDRERRIERFLAACGSFDSGCDNTAEEHDAVLDEAFRDW